MGGTMRVESKGNGEGATFSFTIQAEAMDTPLRARRELETLHPALSDKRVLIVDDNATNRRILTTYLKNWNLLPRATDSPREALTWLERGDPFDAAILDMHMPEMDGAALAQEIRALENPSSASALASPIPHLPLVLFSSVGHRQDTPLFAAQISKPIKPSQLYDTLVNVLAPETSRAPTGGQPMTIDAATASEHPLRILLAEDNVVNQKLALRLLEQIGYRADVAANGIEVLESVARQPYDVILMDVQMPEMDGLEASRRLNAQYPRDARPRIIAMTANAMQGDREMCLAAGMDDYLTKPIRVQELVAALGKTRARGGVEKTGAVLDEQVFQELKTNVGADFIGELITAYLEDAPQLIAEMKRALTANDVDSLRRAAHTLKSNSANFGATTLTALAKELEHNAREGNLNGAREKIARVENELAQVTAALERKQ